MQLAFRIVLTAAALALPASAQLVPRTDAGSAPAGSTQNKTSQPHRTHLILKDGSYQIVMSWSIVGKNVQYISAERNGQTELVPLDLVDIPATKKYAELHPAIDPDAPPTARPAPVLDPELVKEEAERTLVAPEVAPDLRLAPELAILGLDTFRSVPELVPLTQSDGELNQQTGHSILRGIVKPQAAAHQMVVLKGEKAAVQFHVNEPAFFLKLDDAQLPGGPAMTVDTHGASSEPQARKPTGPNDYVIVRVDVRQDARVLASFNIQQLGAKRQEDVFETTATVLAGEHWLKVVPNEQLLVGEYALVEILDEKSINLGVWDFGIHPTAPENRDVIRPEKRRPITLERRRPE